MKSCSSIFVLSFEVFRYIKENVIIHCPSYLKRSLCKGNENFNRISSNNNFFCAYEAYVSYHMSVYRNMPIPSYPEWFQVYVAPAGTERSSVSVFDNASSSNTLDKDTAIASSSLSAETKTPSKNTSENNKTIFICDGFCDTGPLDSLQNVESIYVL